MAGCVASCIVACWLNIDKLSRLWACPTGEYDIGPRLGPVVDTVLGVMRRGSAGGLIVPWGLSELLVGISFESLNSWGQGSCHVFANVWIIRKLLAPK
jgi:hypothetical protein